MIKVGIGVMILKIQQGETLVLLGKRKGAHGEGEWAWPGGHLEYLESVENCAHREVMEETGMKIKNLRFLRVLNLTKYAPKHYIDIGLIADWAEGEPVLKEPDKCSGWDWYKLDNLEEVCQPLFHTIPSMLQTYRNNQPLFYDSV